LKCPTNKVVEDAWYSSENELIWLLILSREGIVTQERLVGDTCFEHESVVTQKLVEPSALEVTTIFDYAYISYFDKLIEGRKCYLNIVLRQESMEKVLNIDEEVNVSTAWGKDVYDPDIKDNNPAEESERVQNLLAIYADIDQDDMLIVTEGMQGVAEDLLKEPIEDDNAESIGNLEPDLGMAGLVDMLEKIKAKKDYRAGCVSFEVSREYLVYSCLEAGLVAPCAYIMKQMSELGAVQIERVDPQHWVRQVMEGTGKVYCFTSALGKQINVMVSRIRSRIESVPGSFHWQWVELAERSIEGDSIYVNKKVHLGGPLLIGNRALSFSSRPKGLLIRNKDLMRELLADVELKDYYPERRRGEGSEIVMYGDEQGNYGDGFY